MGACTSAPRHRKKQRKQVTANESLVLDNKQVSALPLTISSYQRPHSLLTTFDPPSPCLTEHIIYQTDTNSLIQLYSSNMNNNPNRHSWTSSLSSSTSHAQPRIPIPKTRLSLQQSQTSNASKTVTTRGDTINPPGLNKPMSTTNRSSLPSSTQNTASSRFGFIPRPTVPTVQQTQRFSLIERSRSTSPSSTTSANSASSHPSQRITKTQTISNRSTNAPSSTITTGSNASKAKIPPSRITKGPSAITTNTHSRASTSLSSPASIPSVLPSKTDVNSIRERYKAPKRMNFFTRRTPITNSLKSPPIESSIIIEEKNEQLSNDEQTINVPTENQDEDLKTESIQQTSSSHADSAYASTNSSSNRPSSAHYSQANRQRHRAASTLSSSSLLSNVLDQDGLLDDENCSLKSDDLICDYDDTLTLDSISKNNRTDSCSSNSFSMDTNKKSPMITPHISSLQLGSKEQRPTTISKSLTPEKTNGSLRESLDELTRLSNRMDNIIDNDYNRKILTRSMSMKPPPASLPPREDAEQITMDIESYRQVLKDVMVVKTILHQLDRLLKHSDGANMTDSMIGSFHESMVNSRHQSLSTGGGGGDGNFRSNSIDENSSYDDLFKELTILRKEKEQDKQTIKLLQEQMYKYSSQTNG